MNRMTWLQDRRMQKFGDVLSRWRGKQLSAAEAGEILGMSERTFRRFRQRYADEGEAGPAAETGGKTSAPPGPGGWSRGGPGGSWGRDTGRDAAGHPRAPGARRS